MKTVYRTLIKRHQISSLFVSKRLITNTKQPTLYETLKVEEISRDVFEQPTATLHVLPGRHSVFGGQIIGSSMYAAQKTLTKNYPLHSLHSYFLMAADNSQPIYYQVTRLRDGKSFETRSVTARQGDHTIFQCEMSFHRQEHSQMEHQPLMPEIDCKSPEQLLSMYEVIQNLLVDKRLKPELKLLIELALQTPLPLDIRYCTQRDFLQPEPIYPARQLVWMKSLESLPDDPHLHRAAVAYASDWVLLTTAYLPYGINNYHPRIKMQASLDHVMYFHDDFSFNGQLNQESTLSKPIRRSPLIPKMPPKVTVRADDWLLYEIISPIAVNNRALTFGRIWTRNGRLVVSCIQEGVIRFT
ncbi:unnamed protein product [Didymodactylos carnosus]|uniref:Acyl-CoA thioesterase II n=1 Tax=Didymodactylos carnosus TaxID=1234261 RepID=A0A815L3A4_9BILA|nr:unnamed protein product [Didymodactylos carnosus]CAF1402228.1 unnamed protein product [Didymodactylos carnosus]CAF4110687.1 unnamed protein product [Didymodactylos carnosus]CAF4295607.1 unnamed protein product [Didymodactylos carnosus]